MKVLITGGCGFLGSNLSSAFLAEDAEVVVLDALFREGSASNLQWLREQADTKQFNFIKADVSDNDAVQMLFCNHAPFDYVCHVAGQVAMTSSLQDPRRDLETNILGTFNILEAIRKYSPNALLAYSSTNKVYGDLDWIELQELSTRYTAPGYPLGFDEELPLDFSTPYGCSKGAADQYVRDWSRIFGLNTVVFRHSSIYGGRQFSTFDQGWVGWFCQKMIEQKYSIMQGLDMPVFTVSGCGKQVRDVLHASDLVHLYKAAFMRREQCSGHIFNIGGGLDNSLSIRELLLLIQDNINLPELSFSNISRRKSDQDFFVANISKAGEILGWTPKISSSSGIASMLDWIYEIKRQ